METVLLRLRAAVASSSATRFSRSEQQSPLSSAPFVGVRPMTVAKANIATAIKRVRVQRIEAKLLPPRQRRLRF